MIVLLCKVRTPTVTGYRRQHSSDSVAPGREELRPQFSACDHERGRTALTRADEPSGQAPPPSLRWAGVWYDGDVDDGLLPADRAEDLHTGVGRAARPGRGGTRREAGRLPRWVQRAGAPRGEGPGECVAVYEQ